VVIRTENLTKLYGSYVSLDHLNLDVRPAEIYGFLGPNGAGKTTTIHLLLNLLRPTSGQAILFGEPLTAQAFAFRRRIGVVAARLYGVDKPEPRMTELFHALDLWDARHALAHDYSRGMRQKLSLIRALVHEPSLLILDEPVSGLDPHGIRQVRELIHRYRDQGGTVFISSHILSEIERSADRIGILHQGRLLIEDSLVGLRRRIGRGRRLVVELEQIPAPLTERLRTEPYVMELEIDQSGRQLELLLDDDGDARPKLSHLISESGGIILRMESEEMSLEDAFVTITNQNVSRLAGTNEPNGREP
jgi:ABC-2 type transport system ATP-binding protein